MDINFVRRLLVVAIVIGVLVWGMLRLKAKIQGQNAAEIPQGDYDTGSVHRQ